jgi:hypothetical protein
MGRSDLEYFDHGRSCLVDLFGTYELSASFYCVAISLRPERKKLGHASGPSISFRYLELAINAA